MKRFFAGVFWIGVYLVFSLSPLVLVLVGETPPGRSFLVELSVAFGLVGLAMLGLQFALTARFQRVTAPFGIDIILQFHRQISLFAVGLILLHPILIFIDDPSQLALLNPIDAPWRARLGLAGLLALLTLVVLSVWREKLRVDYEVWKMSHAALAVAAIAFSLGHIILVAYYVTLPWQQALWAFMSVGAVVLLIYIRLWKPVRMARRPYQVAEVKEERGDAYTLVLEPSDGKAVDFRPGQFAWIKLWTSPFGIEEHPFSFSSSARDPERPSITVKALGDFTSEMEHVEPGTRVYLDGPYGAFSNERHEAPGFVFITGGVGVTPVMSMLRTLADWDDPRPLLLIYGNPTWEEVIFREEIEDLQERLNLTVVHILEEAPEGWEGEEGFVTPEILEKHLPSGEQRYRREYFVCGPAPMMDAVEDALSEVGIPHRLVHTERFELV